jgi:hypothetical protein
MEPRPSHHSAKPSHTAPPHEAAAWQSSLAEFFHARIELIRLESRDAGAFFAVKIIATAITASAAIIAWACFLVGIIGAATHVFHAPWWICTLLLGFLHLIIAMIAAKKMCGAPRSLFPVTRGEFEKDKLWMQNLKTQKTK